MGTSGVDGILGSIASSQGNPCLGTATEDIAQHRGTPTPVEETPETTTQKLKMLLITETSENVSSVKKLQQTTLRSEPPLLKVPQTNIDDKAQIQVETTKPQQEGPAESATQSALPISENDLQYKLQAKTNVPLVEDTESRPPTAPELSVHEESRRKVLMKDIFLEFSLPHEFSDGLTLSIISGDNFETSHFMKISPTRWRAIEDIDCYCDQMSMTLLVRSVDGGNFLAFLQFTANEIYTMAFPEEDITVEHVFLRAKEDNLGSVKITCTLGSVARNRIMLDESNNFGLRHTLLERCLEEAAQENDDDQLGAISILKDAVSFVPLGDDGLRAFSNILGSSYLRRFENTSKLEDLARAISHHQKAVESTPPGHVLLPSMVSDLGNAYARRFKYTGNLEDIDHAITYHRRAVDSCPSGHAGLPSRFSHLGNSFSSKFDRTGHLKDIDHAISYHEKAVDSAPSGHTDVPSWLNNLANFYLSRFKRTSKLNDINNAISHRQRAVELCPSVHTDLPSWSNNLGISYAIRFECTGRLKDIEHAIFHHRKAVELIPSGHALFPTLLSNLGNSYARHFEVTGKLEDIDHAICHQQKGVELTPSGHARLPAMLSKLGSSYLCRFEHTGKLEDIDHATSHHKKSVELTPSGHAELPIRFSNLGNSYARRFKHTGKIPDTL